MVTEVDSGSHSMIFTCQLLSSVFCEQVIKKPYFRLSVLRNKAENIKHLIAQLTETDNYRISQIIILAISQLYEKYRRAL